MQNRPWFQLGLQRGSLLAFTVTRPVTVREILVAVDSHDRRLFFLRNLLWNRSGLLTIFFLLSFFLVNYFSTPREGVRFSRDPS